MRPAEQGSACSAARPPNPGARCAPTRTRASGPTRLIGKNQIRITIDFPGNFHNRKNSDAIAPIRFCEPNPAKNGAAPKIANDDPQARCTKSGHPLVEGLHSPASKRDKTRHFLLTIKTGGVKTTSFFDTF
jgi:hypothetical protein